LCLTPPFTLFHRAKKDRELFDMVIPKGHMPKGHTCQKATRQKAAKRPPKGHTPKGRQKAMSIVFKFECIVFKFECIVFFLFQIESKEA